MERVAGAAAVPAGRVEVAVEGEERVLPVVELALAAGRRLHLRYHVPGRDETTERDVDPMRLLLGEGRPYLEAWCRRAEGVRLFRLDRVAAVQVLDAPAAPPPDAARATCRTGSSSPRRRTSWSCSRCAPARAGSPTTTPARWWRSSRTASSWPGCAPRTPAGCAGWCCGWAVRKVVEPARARDEVRDEARAALAAYDSPGG